MGTPMEALGLVWRSLYWALFETTGQESVEQLRMAEAHAAAYARRVNPARWQELYG